MNEKIENNQMILNECGKIAEKCWIEIPQHIAHIKTDEFIIMPNHIHGIIIIENDFVGNRHACSLQNENRQYQKLPVTVGSFKSAVSKLIHQQIQQNFQWQKSYYDHIIRDEKSLFNIREYIIKNPLNWDTDKNNLGKDKK